MSKRGIVGLFLVFVIVLVLGVDLLFLLIGWPTISETVGWLNMQSTAIAFIAGFTSGHFFWPLAKRDGQR